MIAVVTGSNGFIGSHLVEELLRQGFFVRCIDIHDCARYLPDSPRITYYCINCADIEAISKTDILEDADYVFHLAGSTKNVKLEAFRKGNVLPTENILQVIVNRNIHLKRFIYISTQAAAGPAESLSQPVSEKMTPHPVGYYAQSKLEGEYAVQRYTNQVPFTILRPASVYGPRDVDFFNIFKQINNHLCLYPGNRDKYISLIYVADFVRGMIQAAQSPRTKNQTYFLCADDSVCWREIYTSIALVEKKRATAFNIPQSVVEFFGKLGDFYGRMTGQFSIVNSQKILLSKPSYWICSAEKAKKDFGFQATVTLSEGLEVTYRWYVENKWL